MASRTNGLLLAFTISLASWVAIIGTVKFALAACGTGLEMASTIR